ncbi:hypothetical protein D3C78_1511040 [compost metagenome]
MKFAPVGNWDKVNFTSQRGADGIVRVNLVASPAPTPSQQQADACLLSQGHAVITVIDGNLATPQALQDQAQAMLRGVKP